MTSRTDNKFFKKSNILLTNKNDIVISKLESYDKWGISEERLINNDKNIETIKNILKCKICKNILLNPYDCSKCGNTFCYKCINNLKQNNLPCPFNCKLFEITPSSFGLKKILNQLKFDCINKKNGCNEAISYTEIENHENNCPYNLVKCPNNECKQRTKKNNLENHIKNECKYTLFKCKNCGLNLNRKEFLLHDQICLQIKAQLDSQSPIINNLSKEQYVKNNKEFNSFINILNGLNEEYFYLFNNDRKSNYYYNYSNKGLITLIKCLISLFQYKFSIIENTLNDINNNIKKLNNDNSETFTKNITVTSDFSNKKLENKSINSKYTKGNVNKIKINKNNSYNKNNKKETKILIKSQKIIDNYNSEPNQKKWETLKFDNSKIKQKTFLNSLYNKEKCLEFFHNRQKSNDIKGKKIELNNNYIKNELFFLGDSNNLHEDKMSRNRTENKNHNMTFTNFIINKKKDIEKKIIGNRLNKSLTSYYNNINNINNSNSFNRSNINNSYGFILDIKENENKNINKNKSFNNFKNNIYEKKIFNSILPIKNEREQH